MASSERPRSAYNNFDFMTVTRLNELSQPPRAWLLCQPTPSAGRSYDCAARRSRSASVIGFAARAVGLYFEGLDRPERGATMRRPLTIAALVAALLVTAAFVAPAVAQ